MNGFTTVEVGANGAVSHPDDPKNSMTQEATQAIAAGSAGDKMPAKFMASFRSVSAALVCSICFLFAACVLLC